MPLKKILLRAPNWVGDSAVATPSMKAIRAKFPDAEITVMVRPSVAGVFASAKYVDRVWTEPKPSRLREWLRIVMEVRKQHFDMAVLFPNSFESAAMVFLGGVLQRVGYAMDSRGWMLTHRLPYTTQRLGHARPALRPVRVVWRHIPLGHRPSLPLLRRPSRALFARFFGTLLVSDFS